MAITEEESIQAQKPVIVERRAKKKKGKKSLPKQYDVEVIPATVGTVQEGEPIPLKRVAAYCRVSTAEEAQASSFELQVKHYTEYIGAHEDWVLAGIYADEGISGTQVKHREHFQRMIEDCEAGKIDMVITKSISRFARNVVDCLTNIRKLKSLNPPVDIYFEKERLYALDEKTDMILSLMASIAQEESRSISANIRWAIKNRMKDGTQKIPTSSLLGYDTDEDGNMVIIEQEAQIVRTIYKSFVQEVHPHLIAKRLNSLELRTVFGNSWTSAAVRNILRNEKYCGDVLMQKTITVDYLTHKTKKNEGEEAQYYIADHHDAIISREIWDKTQEILDQTRWRGWKRREQQRLIPVKGGRLRGFIPISAEWKEVSVTRLLTATGKLADTDSKSTEKTIGKGESQTEREVLIMQESGILEGFMEVDLEQAHGDSVLTVTETNLKFNKATAVELNYPPYIRMLVNAEKKQVAIQTCKESSKNAVKFSKEKEKQKYAVVIKAPALQTAIRKLIAGEGTSSVSFHGELFPNENIIIYDLTKGEEPKRRGKRKKSESAAEEHSEAK